MVRICSPGLRFVLGEEVDTFIYLPVYLILPYELPTSPTYLLNELFIGYRWSTRREAAKEVSFSLYRSLVESGTS